MQLPAFASRTADVPFMTVPATVNGCCKMPMELVFKGRASSVPLLRPLSHCSLAPRSQDSAALKMSARCFVGPPYPDTVIPRCCCHGQEQFSRYSDYAAGCTTEVRGLSTQQTTDGGPTLGPGPAQALSNECWR